MTRQSRFLRACGSIVALASLTVLMASGADAQRRGGGGRMSSMSKPSGSSMNRSASSSRQVRSSATSNINYGRASNGRGTQVASNSGNRANVNSGNRANINSGNRTNINTGDVNINRDVDIDVDNGWGCCGYGGWDYHPVAVAATTAAVTAAVVGSYYRTLPTNCVTVYRGTTTYYQCGTSWYQPVYSGMTVQYVVVAAP